jgi:hypothetical protein
MIFIKLEPVKGEWDKDVTLDYININHIVSFKTCIKNSNHTMVFIKRIGWVLYDVEVSVLINRINASL